MATVAGEADEAVAGITDGSTVLIGGFGTAGQPIELIDALVRSGVRDLTDIASTPPSRPVRTTPDERRPSDTGPTTPSCPLRDWAS